MTREELLKQVEALGEAAKAKGPALKEVGAVLRLYWLALHHELVVEGDSHAQRVNVDAGWGWSG
jgi:hypothetical protein